MYKQATIVGIVLSALVVVFSSSLQGFFNTTSSNMFVVFGLGVPFYFLMSVNRGVYQGKEKLVSLSVTYQLEMISRLLITLLLLQFYAVSTSVIIAIGVFCSFIIGLIPFKKDTVSLKKTKNLAPEKSKIVRSFFLITAFYELTQIIINNSDILLVKHKITDNNGLVLDDTTILPNKSPSIMNGRFFLNDNETFFKN